MNMNIKNTHADPGSASRLEERSSDPLKKKPSESSPGEIPKNTTAATDLPAEVGDKARAAALFDRKQRQRTAWVAEHAPKPAARLLGSWFSIYFNLSPEGHTDYSLYRGHLIGRNF